MPKQKVTVTNDTTINPITTMGFYAGICWGANTSDEERNYKRGLDCLESGHWKALEFTQVYLILDGYSARVIRELYTHQAGQPTKLQASTRYIDYSEVPMVIPGRFNGEGAFEAFKDGHKAIIDSYNGLLAAGVPKEDAAMMLPLGMKTKMVYRTNLRALIEMAKLRLCQRAYYEYRGLMQDIKAALMDYSDEWKFLICDYNILKPKCEWEGFCTERYTCHRMPAKKDLWYLNELITKFHRELGAIPQSEEDLIQALYDIGGKDNDRRDN